MAGKNCFCVHYIFTDVFIQNDSGSFCVAAQPEL